MAHVTCALRHERRLLDPKAGFLEEYRASYGVQASYDTILGFVLFIGPKAGVIKACHAFTALLAAWEKQDAALDQQRRPPHLHSAAQHQERDFREDLVSILNSFRFRYYFPVSNFILAFQC